MKLASCVIIAGLSTNSSIASAQDAPPRADPFRGPIKAAVSEPVWEGTRPRIFLALETANNYGCANFELDTRMQRANDTISVTLHGLVPDNICSPAFGPAHKMTALGLSHGTYVLMISRNGEVDRFQLVISATRIDLRTLGASHFIQANTSSFWRPHPRSFYSRVEPPMYQHFARTWPGGSSVSLA